MQNETTTPWWQGFAKVAGLGLLLTLLGGVGGVGGVASVAGAQEPVRTQRIFRCEVSGQTTFSDRPCDKVPSIEVSLTAVNTYHESNHDAGKASAGSGKRTKSVRKEPTTQRAEAIAAAQLQAAQNCQKLAAQLDKVRSKMRSGYTIEQGETLRERLRELDQRRRTARCR